MTDNSNPADFLSEIESRRGGKVGWRTYSTWFCDGRNLREYGVFLYEIDSVLWYEDFEHRPTLLGYKLPKRKNEPEYEKLQGSFTPADVESVTEVSKVRAVSFFRTGDPECLKPAGTAERILRRLVTLVRLKDGRTLFFELLDRKQFEAKLR
ncbi:MAG: hypothetical protein J5785_02050 [Spirochaetales bacterium]|nr:hypothetical protein [Spirochaetales bacterium]